MLSPLRRRAGKRLREPFGKAGLTVAVVALVFAMLGGAYAASNGSGSGKATASAKGKPGLRGPRGKTGPAGPAGAAGANGKDGANGTNGTNGKDGASGASGKSVVATAESAGANCVAGGTRFEVEGSATKHFACNGKEGEEGEEGEKGEEGSPWVAGGTLPPGSTETGAWGFNGVAADSEIVSSISFAIPLAKKLLTAHVHYVTAAEQSVPSAACPGVLEEPKASPGELCVYEGGLGNASPPTIERLTASGEVGNRGASRSGAALVSIPSGIAFGAGSWAVTGCNPIAGKPFECPAGS